MAEHDRQSPAPRAPSRLGRYVLRAALVIVLLVALLAGALAWLVGSESGLRALSAGLGRITAGQLQIAEPSGRLLDAWSVGSLRWNGGGQEVVIEQLAVAWSPGELRDRHLLIERLAAASVRVTTSPAAPAGEPAALPASLELPLAVTIRQLEIGSVLVGEPGQDAQRLGQNLTAAFASDGHEHHLERLQAQVGDPRQTPGELALQAEAALAGTRPFALTAHASVSGAALEREFAVEVNGNGSLERLQLDGNASSNSIATVATASPSAEKMANATIAGTFQAMLTPFATRPLAALSVHLKDVDPAKLVDGAPTALLDIDAVLDPAKAAEEAASESPLADLAGQVTITNRRSGALDQQLLPVQSVATHLDWVGEKLTFSGLDATLAGGGQLTGTGEFAGGQLDVDLVAKDIDAQALHASLLPTQLAGPLRASVGAESKTFEFDLRDSRYALQGHASVG
ncbi:MAG: hypothetical protein ABI478_07665, partial [Propionivibrio sp.]